MAHEIVAYLINAHFANIDQALFIKDPQPLTYRFKWNNVDCYLDKSKASDREARQWIVYSLRTMLGENKFVDAVSFWVMNPSTSPEINRAALLRALIEFRDNPLATSGQARAT